MDKLAYYIDKVRHSGVGLPILILAMIMLFVMPLPPFLLDIFFTINIVLAIMIVINAVQVEKPLDFAAFPTLIMGAAVMRLALNVASTRIILLEGHEGGDAAGNVIESIASVVIAGDFVVGFIIFAVIMIINLIVINKGAGRVSEVSARFTLDSLPGKQMAIDADLNAGLIDADEAKKRRADTVKEADFYGRMDGSAKFVKGDTVAGILILLINIVGGLIIGTVSHGLDIGDAMETYSLLTIGDGLVAQIPSLIFAVATAIIITRMSESKTLASQITEQLFTEPKNFIIPGTVLILLGIIPGMPHLPFLLLGGTCVATAYYLSKPKPLEPELDQTAVKLDTPEIKRDLDWHDIDLIEDIAIQLGSSLAPLATSHNSKLLDKLRSKRAELSKEFGFLIPRVHITSDLTLAPTEYAVTIQGTNEGSFTLMLDHLLAVNTGNAHLPMNGRETLEPTMRTAAYWINKDDKAEAEINGYLCVDPVSVIITHAEHLIRHSASKFINHESTNSLLEKLKSKSPKLIEETIPERITLSALVNVLQSLLQDDIPIANLSQIIEKVSLIEGEGAIDQERLLAAARVAAVPSFLDKTHKGNTEIPLITLDEASINYALELINNLKQNGITPSLPLNCITTLRDSLKRILDDPTKEGLSILTVPSSLRQILSDTLRTQSMNISVISTEELPSNKIYNVAEQAKLTG